MKNLYIISSTFLAFALNHQAVACTAGQVSWINGCEARCTSSWKDTLPSCSDECIATTPSGYTRIDHSASVISQNNGSHSISTLEAGQQHDYTSKVTASYQEAINLAIKYNDLAAEAKLRQEMQQAITSAIHAKATHQNVQVKVSASRRGNRLFDKVRGWTHVRVKLKVLCLAPSNLPQQIIAKAKIKDNRFRRIEPSRHIMPRANTIR